MPLCHFKSVADGKDADSLDNGRPHLEKKTQSTKFPLLAIKHDGPLKKILKILVMNKFRSNFGCFCFLC